MLIKQRCKEKEKREGIKRIYFNLIFRHEIHNDPDTQNKSSYLVRDKEHVLSPGELKDKFQASIGTIINKLKRKHDYI